MTKTNPDHYRRGAIEPWDFITSQGLGFLEGNVIKYIARAGHKAGESRLDDLAKAATYLRKLIDTTPHPTGLDDASGEVPEDHGSTGWEPFTQGLRDPAAAD